MIFARKYVFETKRTRALRLALNSLVLLVGVVVLYVTFLVFILATSKSENNRVSEGLYQKSPDAIVVFTGDKGRIKRSLELIKKWPEAKMLISGVHGANNLQTIVSGHSDAEALLNSSSQVDIDYEAMDTLGNVRKTLEHIEQSQEKIQRVLVISSDYHIMRIRMIFNAQNTKPGLQIFYEGVSSDWSQWSSIKKIILESAKTLRIWFLLTFSKV